ncbi:MAG TPA: HAD family hydrolase, partial [Candidatus Poseidoniales archaeon]|nr:HAD family hydrolase [Candidatus Poseidoniales archaeon]
MTLRIAMWSGPRNISTAMMRAWENRPDTVVVDEPLYAHFLAETGIEHPGRDEVIAAGETDWQLAIAGLLAPVESAIFYQKQMTHHLLPHINRGWMAEVRNCFLIRDPREVLLSYAKKRADVTVDDVGILQQAEIFDHVCELTGEVPPVLDAKDVLTDPRKVLGTLCQRLDIEFCDEMLAWPSG